MRQPLVAGNWKMNGSTDSIKALVEGLKAGIDSVTTAEMAVCPPYVYISQVAGMLSGSPISYGAQDVSDQEAGAYTGEVAPAMLTDIGCKYAIVGHSERRSLYGERDADTAGKFAAARKAGLVPILCVGELLEEREQGITEQVVERQLDAVIDLEGVAAFGSAVIAYEPVWAIGTGKTATPDQAQEVHAFIRNKLAGLDQAVADGVDVINYSIGGGASLTGADDLAFLFAADAGVFVAASAVVRPPFDCINNSGAVTP